MKVIKHAKGWPATYWILAVLGAVFAVQMVFAAMSMPVAVETPVGSYRVSIIEWNFALWPSRVLSGDAVWGVFTSIFLHAGFIHFFFNSFALFMFGLFMERRFGGGNMLKIFLLSGIAGSLAHLGFSAATGWAFYIPALGASGGIFGVLGALMVTNPDIRIITMPIMVPMKLWKGILMFLIFSIAFIPSVAHDVHIAGMLVGIAIGWRLKKKMAKRDYIWHAVYTGGGSVNTGIHDAMEDDPYSWIDEYR